MFDKYGELEEDNKILKEKIDDVQRLLRDVLIFLKPPQDEHGSNGVYQHIKQRTQALFSELTDEALEAHLAKLEAYE